MGENRLGPEGQQSREPGADVEALVLNLARLTDGGKVTSMA